MINVLEKNKSITLIDKKLNRIELKNRLLNKFFLKKIINFSRINGTLFNILTKVENNQYKLGI